MSEKSVAAAAGTFEFGNLSIHRMGFGAMRITGPGIWGPPEDKENAKSVLQTVLDLGITFIDTADSYGPEVSENLIAEALHPYPHELVIGTKGGLTRPGPNQWKINARPDHLEAACKASLKRLKLDRIDLYQLHRFDPDVPMAETLGLLKELRQQGYIRHLGLSEVSVEQCEQAAEHIEFVSVQNKYSITFRKWEPVLDWCAERNIAFLPWNPVDAGELDNADLQKIADAHGATVYQIALAWLLQHKPNMTPIPGTSSVPHLRENTASAEIELTPEDMATLNGIGG